MRLVFPEINFEIKFTENMVNVISIEHTKIYADILADIWRQCNGSTGNLILSDNGNILKMKDSVSCIYNPFSIDLNDRKTLSILYKELIQDAHDILTLESSEFLSNALEYMDKVISTSSYSLCYDDSISLSELFKLFHVKIQSTPESLLESLIDYVKVQSRVCRTKLLIFQNLKYYLNEEELKQLYEFSFYEKINILIIESMHSPAINTEKSWIIDRDCCIIELN